MRCAQCNEVNAWTLARCWSCGAPLAASTTSDREHDPSPGTGVRDEGPPAPYRTPGAHAVSPAGVTAFAFDARRWTLADQITGGATLVLLVSLFLPWFGTDAAFLQRER